MSKKAKEVKKEKLTDVQIKVDVERRTKLANEEIGKVCEKYEIQLVPGITAPMYAGVILEMKPTIKIVSIKKYEEATPTEPAKK
jgi:hypothetical protein